MTLTVEDFITVSRKIEYFLIHKVPADGKLRVLPCDLYKKKFSSLESKSWNRPENRLQDTKGQSAAGLDYVFFLENQPVTRIRTRICWAGKPHILKGFPHYNMPYKKEGWTLETAYEWLKATPMWFLVLVCSVRGPYAFLLGKFEDIPISALQLIDRKLPKSRGPDRVVTKETAILGKFKLISEFEPHILNVLKNPL